MKIKIDEHDAALIVRLIHEQPILWALINANNDDANKALALQKRLFKLAKQHKQTTTEAI